MKKNLLLFMLMLASFAGYSQFTLQGKVRTNTMVAVSGQVVYAMMDSLLNPPSTPFFVLSATTDPAGAFTITLPSSIATGVVVNVHTANCTGSDLVNTFAYAGVNTYMDFFKCATAAVNIQGLVKLGTTNNPAANAKVYIIKQDSTTSGVVLSLMDSTVTNAYGHYTAFYPTIPTSANILVKAALQPSASNYSSYLPTYSASSLMWSGATAVYKPAPSGGVNISLIAGTNPGGPAFIGGNVLMGANKPTAGVGDPLPGRQIILTNGSNVPVAYTYSDAQGKFSFPSLAYGTYKISGDVLGRTSAPLTITLSATNGTVNNVQFDETSKTFDAKLATGVQNIASNLSAVVVYPNPATDNVYVAGLDAIKGGKTITLMDVTGKQLFKSTYAQGQAVTVNVSAIASGMYMMNIATEEGTVTYKITK